MINTNIKGLHMPLTDALKAYVHEKVSSLENLVSPGAFLYAEIGKPSHHHKGGEDVFQAEITLDTNGQTYFVKTTESDLYRAIDRAAADMLDMVKQGRGKRQTLLRRGRMAIKQLLKRGGL
jgi:ribosomal subunit interface protein